MKAVARADDPGLQEIMPDWVSAALPQRQADIMAEIGRLQAEIEKLQDEAGSMESMARLLWQAGPQLEDVIVPPATAGNAHGRAVRVRPSDRPVDHHAGSQHRAAAIGAVAGRGTGPHHCD